MTRFERGLVVLFLSILVPRSLGTCEGTEKKQRPLKRWRVYTLVSLQIVSTVRLVKSGEVHPNILLSTVIGTLLNIIQKQK